MYHDYDYDLYLQPPPRVCDFQSAELMLVVRTLESNTRALPDMIEVSYSGQPEQVVIPLPPGLLADQHYILTISATTLAGNISTTLLFSEIIIEQNI